MIRLFTGISLPVLLRQRLALLQGGLDGAKWTERDNLHLTLNFIGEVSEQLAEDVDEALSGIRMESFPLELKGTGSFSSGRDIKVLWVGVAPSEPLHRLKEKIDRTLEKYAIPFEKRKYHPHVTLARFRFGAEEAKVAQFMAGHNLFSGDAFEVDHFTLFRTHQTKHGSEYEALAEYPLS
jgi:2'-5' RNA ligase